MKSTSDIPRMFCQKCRFQGRGAYEMVPLENEDGTTTYLCTKWGCQYSITRDWSQSNPPTTMLDISDLSELDQYHVHDLIATLRRRKADESRPAEFVKNWGYDP